MRSLRRSTASVASGLKVAGKTAAALAIPVGIVAAKIGKTGADFEEAITAVGAVGLKTRDQIANLEAEALRLGSTTKFTATEAANAMEIMAKAGFTNKEILAGVGGVLNAAAASGLEMGEVADHVSNVLKGMGLAASDASRVADVLALASSRTNSSIGTLGESMRNVASTARQLGVPLEEVVAGVALLQDVGLDASVAGSAMNTMLTKLAAPTAGMQKQLKKLGVAFKDDTGNMLPFTEVLANISKAAKGAGGNMDQVALLADLVGLRGQKAAANLKDLFEAGKLQSLTTELQNAEGAAEKMAQLRMQNLKGDLTLLGSAVDGLSVALFNTEAGPMRDFVQSITKFVGDNQNDIVGWFQDAMGAAREFGIILKDNFLPVVEPLAEAFREMMTSEDPAVARQWAGTFKSLAANLGKLLGVTVMVGAAFATLTVAVGVAVNSLVSGTIGAFEGLVKFFGQKLFAFTNWWQDLHALFDAEGTSLSDRMLEIGKHVVMGLVKGLQSVATAPIDMIKDIGTGVWEALNESLGVKSPSTKTAYTARMTVAGYVRESDRLLPQLGAAVGRMNSTLSMVGARPDVVGGGGVLEGKSRQEPQVISLAQQHAAASRESFESVSREQVELLIRDPDNRTELRRGARRGSSLRVHHSGNFH